jgi:urease
VSHLVGSLEVGKLADLVLYSPANFGAKPDLVLKGGCVVRAQMGDANGSIPTTEPILDRPMFASFPSTTGFHSILFVSQVSRVKVVKEYGLRKKIEPVKNCRGVSKRDMKLNDVMPKIHVDPETFLVTADGVPCECDPIPLGDTLPLSQLYYIF